MSRNAMLETKIESHKLVLIENNFYLQELVLQALKQWMGQHFQVLIH